MKGFSLASLAVILISIFTFNTAQAQSCAGSILVSEGKCGSIFYYEADGYECTPTLDAKCGNDACKYNVTTKVVYHPYANSPEVTTQLNKTYFCDPSGSDKGCNGLNSSTYGMYAGNIPKAYGYIEICVSKTSTTSDSGTCLDGSKCSKAQARLKLGFTSYPPAPAIEATATPTSIPTSTPTAIPASPNPFSNAGGPYAGISGAKCTAGDTSLQLNGSGHSNQPAGTSQSIQFAWTSNCTNAQFSDPSIANPILTFQSTIANAVPAQCQASLTVTDAKNQASVDVADIMVGLCVSDCKGQINGTAKTDSCGLCEGDGTSCLQCNKTDITAAQHSLDTHAGSQRNLVFKTVSLVKKALPVKTVAKLQSKFKSIRNEAQNLYLQNWTLIYSMPSVILGCPSSQTCASVSNLQSESVYHANSERFAKLLTDIKRIAGNNRNAVLIVTKAIEASKKLDAANVKLLASIPDTMSVCK